MITPASRSASPSLRNAEHLLAVATRSAGHGGLFRQFYISKAAVNSHLLWLAVLMPSQHHRRPITTCASSC